MFPKAWLPVVLCSILLGMQGASASAALPEFSKTGLSLSAESASASLETTNGVKIKCGASVAKGEVIGAKTIGGYQQTYKGCAMGSIKCSSSGAAAGEVKTESLGGEIGYVSSTEKRVGLRFESSKGKSFVIAEPSCSGVKIPIKGAVIGVIGPINNETTKFELIQSGSEGIQSIKKFEGLEEEVLKVEATRCDLNSNSAIAASSSLSITA